MPLETAYGIRIERTQFVSLTEREAWIATCVRFGYEPILPADDDEEFCQKYINFEMTMNSLRLLARG